MSTIATLFTIPFSHYCEKARWGLDICGIQYQEVKRLPLFHLPTVSWVLRNNTHATSDKTSSRNSTPVLKCPDGALISDSTDILKYSETQNGTSLHLDDDTTMSVVERLGNVLGPHTRRLAYHHVLADKAATRIMAKKNVGAFQSTLFSLTRPLAASALKKVLNVTPQSAARSLQIINEELDWIESMLGKEFLCGDEFSAADLTFAALATPILLITRQEGFGGHLPSINDMQSPYSDMAIEFRGRPAGQHALNMYQRYRTANAFQSPT